MRDLVGHKVNGVNDGIKLTVIDGPGPGGANHHYRMEYDDPKWGPDKNSMRQVHEVYFQNGPIAEKGTNGLTHEVLLEIIKDRLRGFQSGPYECDDNAEALEHVEAAQECLMRRTRARAARGVEGTMTV